MKKSSLALIAAISMLGSVAAQAVDGAGTTTGGTTLGGSTGVIVGGSIAAGAALTGVLVAANSSDGNPVTNTGTGTGTTTGTGN
ncbi:hypothetical protein [Shewanella sp. KJ2020]|uniref:hypothetical protein n=1 Tax=Shewanella sp. KJ2020 TaxID=2919172 RepID=UPI0020A832BE|nr:hypothetical protein [Shewanella sp. KJ2020]MCP3130357.1 hypothetical protein [Shewanella sp. KJ2020]